MYLLVLLVSLLSGIALADRTYRLTAVTTSPLVGTSYYQVLFHKDGVHVGEARLFPGVELLILSEPDSDRTMRFMRSDGTSNRDLVIVPKSNRPVSAVDPTKRFNGDGASWTGFEIGSGWLRWNGDQEFWFACGGNNDGLYSIYWLDDQTPVRDGCLRAKLQLQECGTVDCSRV